MGLDHQAWLRFQGTRAHIPTESLQWELKSSQAQFWSHATTISEFSFFGKVWGKNQKTLPASKHVYMCIILVSRAFGGILKKLQVRQKLNLSENRLKSEFHVGYFRPSPKSAISHREPPLFWLYVAWPWVIYPAGSHRLCVFLLSEMVCVENRWFWDRQILLIWTRHIMNYCEFLPQALAKIFCRHVSMIQSNA